jgi:D-aminopeptidase
VPRPRDFDLPLGYFAPGNDNAITDVAGVRVGHVTIRDTPAAGAHSDINTGVTCIWPHGGWPWEEGVYAATHVLNGHGEIIGITEVDEYGLLQSPILLASSLNIGAVYDATARWASRFTDQQGRATFLMPVVGEVSDGQLSDSRRFPVTPAHVEQALTQSSTQAPEQGAVGAGTGTVCYDLKGGIGSSSRVVPADGQHWTIGALVLTNYGMRRNLTISGVCIGPELNVPMPGEATSAAPEGSCIVVVATDAPLLPHQLRRLAVRGSLGLTRSGGFAGHASGEITLAFSTAARLDARGGTVVDIRAVRDGSNKTPFNRLFEAAVEAVNEAVLNCLFEATTTYGFEGTVVHALPIEDALEILARHGVRGRRV